MNNKYNREWLWNWSSFNRGINLGYSIVWLGWPRDETRPRGNKRIIVINIIIGSIVFEDTF